MSTDAGIAPGGVEPAAQVVDRLGARSSVVSSAAVRAVCGEQRRGRERAPAIAVVGDPLAGPAAVAADPDRRVRLGRPAAGGR